MYTAAGGGVSHVICSSDHDCSLEQEGGCKQRPKIRLEATRVQPLCMTEDVPDPEQWLGCGLRNAVVLPVEGLSDEVVSEDEILFCLREHGPANLETLTHQTGLSGILLEKRLERLAYLQQVRMAGFTRPMPCMSWVSWILAAKSRPSTGPGPWPPHWILVLRPSVFRW